MIGSDVDITGSLLSLVQVLAIWACSTQKEARWQPSNTAVPTCLLQCCKQR